MEEQWKSIDEEGRYEVSNFGNVRSYVDFHGKLSSSSHFLKSYKGKNGYLMVILHLEGKRTKGYLIHRLVAEAFLPNTSNYRCVNHKDENKTNNNVDNLEWCSHKYNNNYGTKPQRLSKSLTNNPHFIKPVYQLDKQGNIINEFPSITIAANSIGCRPSDISRVCSGLSYRHTSHGFAWRFKNN